MPKQTFEERLKDIKEARIDDLDSDELENEYEDDEDVPFPEVERAD